MQAGVSEANLVEAACELHALLQRRSAAGLGPLIGAQGYLTPPADPGNYPDKGESRMSRRSTLIPLDLVERKQKSAPGCYGLHKRKYCCRDWGA